VLPAVRQVLTAGTGAEGLAQARTQRPDVVLLDLRLPDADGLELADELGALPHVRRIVLVTARADDAALHAAASRPHITGLIWKNLQMPHLLPRALDVVAGGGRFHPPEVRAAWCELKRRPDAFYKYFSPRELEFAALLGRGLSDGEVAEKLGVGTFAARSQRQRIMQKLGLHRSVDLVHWAIRTGLVEGRARLRSGFV
jgi:DNA-binding NarL/FixJ family response regulator